MSSRAPSRPPTRASSTRPGTSASATAAAATKSDDGEWILAISPGRGVGREVGVVAIEKDLGRVVLTQYADSATFVKTLHLCTTRPPSTILVPDTALGVSERNVHPLKVRGGQLRLPLTSGSDTGEGLERDEPDLLVKSLRDQFRTSSIIGVPRKLWNEQSGYEFIVQLIVHDATRTATLMASKSRYYALGAACALFKHLETAHSLVFPPRSLRIEYQPLEGTCMVDVETAKNLELVSNLLNVKSSQHLLGLMNQCFTPMAVRLLRTNILSPLTDVSVIDTRLDTVEELVSSEERFIAIRKALEPLKSLDSDKLIGQLIALPARPSFTSSQDPSATSEQRISRLLLLRQFLLALPALRASLAGSDAVLLRTIARILSDEREHAEDMLEAIAETVNEEAIRVEKKGKKGGGGGALAGRNRKIYAVKAERKLLLDVARETYRESLADAFELCESLKAQHGLDGMALQFSSSGSGGGQFIFTAPRAEWDEKDSEGSAEWRKAGWINVNKKGKNRVEFSSMILKQRNNRINESVQEIFLMSDQALEALFDEIRGSIASLYRCSEAIALLDMLASFAEISSKNDYVRPEFTDTLAIKAGRHPLHEQFRLADGAFVPNDTYASDAASFQIVTGANMAGKSTLLRQIALMQIMAQVGCFVPATYASFRPVDALLSRLSNDDSIEASLSTFAQEMTTMSMILAALEGHRQCLVIVDELGRGTSPEEGVGIAHALAEEIIKSQAICFFATHFKELSQTLARYPNVVTLHLQTEMNEGRTDQNLTFHHRVVDGVTPLTHYGLALAKDMKLPSTVVARASEVSAALASMADAGRRQSQSAQLATRRRELLRLTSRLKDLHQSQGFDGTTLMHQIRQLQQDAIEMLSATLPALEEIESEPNHPSPDLSVYSATSGVRVHSISRDQVFDEEDVDMISGSNEPTGLASPTSPSLSRSRTMSISPLGAVIDTMTRSTTASTTFQLPLRLESDSVKTGALETTAEQFDESAVDTGRFEMSQAILDMSQ